MAISISSRNPLLLIGAELQLTAGVKGVINNGTVVYFRKIHERLKIEFSINSIKVQKSIKNIKIGKSIESMKIESSIESAKWKPQRKGYMKFLNLTPLDRKRCR